MLLAAGIVDVLMAALFVAAFVSGRRTPTLPIGGQTVGSAGK